MLCGSPSQQQSGLFADLKREEQALKGSGGGDGAMRRFSYSDMGEVQLGGDECVDAITRSGAKGGLENVHDGWVVMCSRSKLLSGENSSNSLHHMSLVGD